MRSIHTAIWALALALLGTALLPTPGAAQQVKGPPNLTVPQGKDSPGVVTFSHEFHMGKVGKCTECHVKIFKMKKGTSGELSMAKMKEGQQCGACHNGKKEVAGTVVFTTEDKANCQRCHKK